MLKKLEFLISCAFIVCAAMPATVYAESFTTQNAAIETITQHTLTFYPNCTDDSYFISESSIDIPESDKYGTLPVPSRKGYEFLGWYTASDGGNKVSESTVMGSGDAVVYAHWAAYTITINYMTDGAKTWRNYPKEVSNDCSKQEIAQSETVGYDEAYPHANFGVLDVDRLTKAGYKTSHRWKVGSKDSSVMVVDTNWSEELATSATGKTVARYLGVDAQLEQGDVTVDLYPYFIENSYNSVVNGVAPASTTVEAYVPTLYSLIVPESVTLGGDAGSGDKTVTFPVTVKGDIGLSQEVNVSTTPPTMKSSKAADVLASVETPKTTWNRDDALAGVTSNYMVKANLTPGDWSGTVYFACTILGD